MRINLPPPQKKIKHKFILTYVVREGVGRGRRGGGKVQEGETKKDATTK